MAKYYSVYTEVLLPSYFHSKFAYILNFEKLFLWVTIVYTVKINKAIYSSLIKYSLQKRWKYYDIWQTMLYLDIEFELYIRADSSAGKKPTCNGDPGSIPGRSPGGGHGNPLQYSCLKNPHGQRSLAGSSPWDRKELEASE